MKENSRFYSSLSLLILLNAVVKPIWILGIDRQVQNETGVAEYGTYFSIFSLSIVFSFLLDWGLTNFYNRQLSANDKTLINQAGSILFLKLLSAVVYAGVIFSIAVITGIKRLDIVLYVVLIQILTSLFVFLRAIITSQQWFHTDAWLSVLDKLLMILVCGPFLYISSLRGTITIERFLLIQISCTGVAVIAAFFILAQRKFHFLSGPLWPGQQVFRAALPFTIIVLLMSFHTRIDGFLLERMGNASEAGKYAAAYRLLDASNMVGYLFASFLLPYIARNWSESKSIDPVVLNIRHILLVFSITASAFTFFLAPWIQRVLYHHDDPDSVWILQRCLPALIGYALVQVYGTVMTATGHVVAFSYITLVAVIINVTGNVLFIPSFGAKASCIAALVSQGICGLSTMWYCRQKLHLGLHLRSVLIYIFIAAAVSALLYLTGDGSMNKGLVIVCTAVLVVMIVWVTKLLNLGLLKDASIK